MDAARVRHDPIYLTRCGRWVAAVIDAGDLDRLIADGEAAIPWVQVKADLGLA